MSRFPGPLLLLSLLLFTATPVRADQLRLANGDVIHGEILNWAIDHVLLDHPQLGLIRLSLEQLDIETGKRPSPGLFGTRFLRGWSRNVGFGMNGELGTTDTINLTATLDFDYADEFKRWVFDARYLFNKEEDADDGDNNLRLDLGRDWLFPGSRWFLRTATRYQFDQFESWKHRTILAAGPGYHLLTTEQHTIDIALLPTYTREAGQVDDDKSELTADFGYKWRPSDRFSFSLDNQFFTELSPDGGEYRNFTIARWKLLLTKEPELDLSIRLENEYESETEGNDDNNSLSYFLTMGLSF